MFLALNNDAVRWRMKSSWPNESSPSRNIGRTPDAALATAAISTARRRAAPMISWPIGEWRHIAAANHAGVSRFISIRPSFVMTPAAPMSRREVSLTARQYLFLHDIASVSADDTEWAPVNCAPSIIDFIVSSYSRRDIIARKCIW